MIDNEREKTPASVGCAHVNNWPAMIFVAAVLLIVLYIALLIWQTVGSVIF